MSKHKMRVRGWIFSFTLFSKAELARVLEFDARLLDDWEALDFAPQNWSRMEKFTSREVAELLARLQLRGRNLSGLEYGSGCCKIAQSMLWAAIVYHDRVCKLEGTVRDTRRIVKEISRDTKVADTLTEMDEPDRKISALENQYGVNIRMLAAHLVRSGGKALFEIDVSKDAWEPRVTRLSRAALGREAFSPRQTQWFSCSNTRSMPFSRQASLETQKDRVTRTHEHQHLPIAERPSL